MINWNLTKQEEQVIIEDINMYGKKLQKIGNWNLNKETMRKIKDRETVTIWQTK